MVLRVFNVAEKPSAAKEIVTVLRQGSPMNTRQTQSRYNHVYEFSMTISGHPSNMVFTSVLGHLKGTDFEQRVRKWGSCDPATLLNPDATRVEWTIPDDKRALANTLRTEARRADWLILWLDCDSEGEKIAYDVAQVCKESKPSLVVKRARFSAMTRQDLFRAINSLDLLNENVANMVATRQEIDLRAGSAYTRLLTVQLEKFALSGEDRSIVSYGPCQFPTLGLVVDRWLRIENFVIQPFWVIDLTLKDCKVPFEWMRKHLFDEYTAMTLYELCVEEAELDGNVAVVTRVDKRQRNRWRPLPLSTVELQKVASRSLRISSHRTMEIAEALYNKGLISYPRTETDQFARSYNLRSLVEKQTSHQSWGAFASRLLTPANPQDSVTFTWPRAGRNDDKAHPPIHPTDSAPNSFESNEHQRVYEYVTKRFLACCSIDAVGAETRVEVRAGVSEYFSAKGLIVEERGYLEVIHPFEQWNDKDMPVALLQVNARIPFESLLLRASQTQPPPLLQEADLIALMDHHGIGTDATIAEHIQKVQDRNYVEKLHGSRFSPTNIGKALVIAHEQIELHLARPHMRAKQESDLKRILTGQIDAEEVLRSALQEYLTKFQVLRENRSAVDDVFRARFTTQTAQTWNTLIANFTRCGVCQHPMALKTSNRSSVPPARGSRGRGRTRGRGRGGNSTRHASLGVDGADRCVYCTTCDRTLKMSRNGNLTGTGQPCAVCGYEVVKVVNTSTGSEHTLCPKCLNEPPTDAAINPEQKANEFRCFSCAKADCQFSRRPPAGLDDVAKCPLCQKPCVVRSGRESNNKFISCSASSEECSFRYWFPRNTIESITADEGLCGSCNSKKLRVRWSRGAVPSGVSEYFGCIWCEVGWTDVLRSIGEESSVPQPPHPGNTTMPSRGRGRGRGSRGGGGSHRGNSSGRGGSWRGSYGRGSFQSGRSGDIEDVAGRGNNFLAGRSVRARSRRR